MANLKLTLTCADYARLTPLATGEVKPEGIDLDLVRGPRDQMLYRATQDASVAGGEGSMGAHLRRIDRGDRSFVGLPIYMIRSFPARGLYVRKDGPVRTPADLPGKRVGIYNWVASGSVWHRHLLQFLGVPMDSVQWYVGVVEPPANPNFDLSRPAHVQAAPEGRFLAQMLADGELDALMSEPPKLYDPVNGPIVRLFPDIRAIESAYYQQTHVYPASHLLILKRSAWEANPWIARSLTDAFAEANNRFLDRQQQFPYLTPWLEAEIEGMRALFGPDYQADGIGTNRPMLETFAEVAHQAGLTERRVAVDDYFAEYLKS